MKRLDTAVCKNCIYLAAVIALIIVAPVAAGEADPTRADIFDVVFWFRAALTGLLTILIWLAKNSDARIKELETKALTQIAVNAARTEVIHNLDRRLQFEEHERKQIISMINMQREMVLTNYHDKEDTERHRTHVESSLNTICQDIKDIHNRINGLDGRRNNEERRHG